MRPPHLKEYDLTAEEYEDYKASPARSEAATNKAADTLAIVAGVVYGLSRFDDVGLLPAALAGLFGWLVAWFVTHIAASVIVSLGAEKAFASHPAHSRVVRYEAAKAQYEAEKLAERRTLEQYWLSLGGRQFELELANLYTFMGYEASPTQCSRDQGIDINLRRKGDTVIVQCKAHDKPVGPAAVRELYGALLDCGADRAILASVSDFTKGAKDFARGKPLLLLGLAEIVSMAAEVRGERGRHNNALQRTRPAQASEPRR